MPVTVTSSFPCASHPSSDMAEMTSSPSEITRRSFFAFEILLPGKFILGTDENGPLASSVARRKFASRASNPRRGCLSFGTLLVRFILLYIGKIQYEHLEARVAILPRLNFGNVGFAFNQGSNLARCSFRISGFPYVVDDVKVVSVDGYRCAFLFRNPNTAKKSARGTPIFWEMIMERILLVTTR